MRNTKAVTDRFDFEVDYQWTILKFIVMDKNGYKALGLVEAAYFDLVDQQTIIKALKRFQKSHNRVPASSVVLAQELKTTFKTKLLATSLTDEDRKRIVLKAKSLYKKPVKDGDALLESCIRFASYVRLKKVLETSDITDFTNYGALQKAIQQAINIGTEIKEDHGVFLVAGAKTRSIDRKYMESSYPTPFWQINRWTSSKKGYPKGTLITIIDKPKAGKTNALINIARGYMKMQKYILYIDLENGQQALATRTDMSIMRMDEPSIMNGEYDDRLLKMYRKYKRVGTEMVIKRFPAHSTTINDLQLFVDLMYNEYGIKFEVGIIDYVALMGSLSGKTEDKDRISDVYLDVKNFAEKNDFETIWTGHHVTRPAYVRRPTKYLPGDTAKCIDINRHVDAMISIQQDEQEESNGVCRIEVIEQRKGEANATAYFWMDHKTQRIDEFSKAQVNEYRESINLAPKLSAELPPVKKPKGHGDI